MYIKDWKKELITIPNLLSLFRLIMIPVYIVIYANGSYFVSAAILAVSCLTDMIDGKIARKFNMVTAIGKILDPLADKATQFSLILCLSLDHPVLWWLVGCFVIKESFQLIAGTINLKKGIMLKGALISGKICTTVLFISLILMVLFPNMPHAAYITLTFIDLVFMLVSFVDYGITYATRTSYFQSIEDTN